MAVLKKIIVGKKEVAGPATGYMPLNQKLGLSLPTEVNVVPESMGEYTTLLYGAKKIGKTSLLSNFPKAFFLSTEPGTKALEVFSRPVRNWSEFIGYIELLESEDGNRFETIIVDTIDNAYEYAFDFICKKKLINHPHEENDFGATWKEISQLFRDAVLRLISTNKGIVFVSHDIEKEVELRDGSKVDRVQPTMSKQAMGVVEALVDLIFNYSYNEDKRILRIDGNQTMVAGCRIETKFLRKGGKPRTAGDKIITIDMGRTSKESYDNLVKAFNNEQELTDITLKLKTSLPLKTGKKTLTTAESP